MNHSPNVAAVAIVILLNWYLAHQYTEWVMPSEVQSAVQLLISVGGAFLIGLINKAKET